MPCVGLVDVTWAAVEPPNIETGSRWFGAEVGCGPDGSTGHLAFVRSDAGIDVEFTATGVVGIHAVSETPAFLFRQMSQILSCA